MANGKTKAVAVAALTMLLAVAVAVLAGVGAANPGHGRSAGSAQYQYGSSAGKQYGLQRVEVCHKGHTIKIALPALKAHLNHGDVKGACPTASTVSPTQQTSPTQHGNSGDKGNAAPTTLPAQANGNASGNHGHGK